MGKRAVCFLTACWLFWGSLAGQPVEVKGFFLEDSVLLGSPATYVLVAEYPGSIKILFPDSTYDFSPFEFNGKQFFPSFLRDGKVVDSVVYRVATFELQPWQTMALPVFQLRTRDSLSVYAETDSLLITGLLDDVPQGAKLKETVDFNPLELAFNYPYLVFGLLLLSIVSLAVYLFFGNSIKKRIRLYRMRKRYEKFSNSYSEYLRKLRAEADQHLAESAFISWKSYLESLEKVPYTKLTTREIVRNEENEHLKSALKNIDRNIYGRILDKELFRYFETLEDISLEKYRKKVEEVSHG